MTNQEDQKQLLNVFRDVFSEAPADVRKVIGRVEILDESTLGLLEYKVRVRPILIPNAKDAHPLIHHLHVVTELQSRIGPMELTACVVGLHEDRAAAIRQAATNWLEHAAPPIFSMLHAKEVLGATHFSGSEEWGVPNRYGFVGPLSIKTMILPNQSRETSVDGEKLTESSLFANVDELVFDTIPQLAKVTVSGDMKGHWQRALEFGEHELGFVEQGWQPPVPLPNTVAVITRFAVFFQASEGEVVRPLVPNLDEAIRQFVSAFESVSDEDFTPQIGVDYLCSLGCDPDWADRLSQFAIFAFGLAVCIQYQANQSQNYVRIHSDGTYDQELPLHSEPMFQQALALVPVLHEQGDPARQSFIRVGFCDRDAHLLSDLKEEYGNTKNAMLPPHLLFDRNIDDDIAAKAAQEITEHFYEKLKNQESPKKWWQLWK